MTVNIGMGSNGGNGAEEEKGQQYSLSYEIPGFEDAVDNSIDMIFTKEHLFKTKVQLDSL